MSHRQCRFCSIWDTANTFRCHRQTLRPDNWRCTSSSRSAKGWLPNRSNRHPQLCRSRRGQRRPRKRGNRCRWWCRRWPRDSPQRSCFPISNGCDRRRLCRKRRLRLRCRSGSRRDRRCRVLWLYLRRDPRRRFRRHWIRFVCNCLRHS